MTAPRSMHRTRATVLTATLALMLILSACGSDGSASTDEPAGDDLRVAILTIGNQSDGAFGQALYAGGQASEDLPGVDVKYVGNLVSPDQYTAQGSSFAEDGYDLVFLGHGGVGQIAVQLANQFPDTAFCVPTLPFELGKLPPNTCFFLPRAEIGGFRSGVLAALISQTGHVASNQSFVFPGLTMQVEAFRLGAECVSSSVVVSNAVTNEDIDPAVTKTAAEAQIADGADVLFGATGPAMTGMFQAASDADVRAIGQYVDSTDVSPDVVLASSIPNFQDAIPFMVDQFRNDDLPTEQMLGLDAPFEVGYLAFNAELYDALPDEVKASYDEIDAKITSGEIDVPDISRIGEPGSAEAIDAADLGCSPSA